MRNLLHVSIIRHWRVCVCVWMACPDGLSLHDSVQIQLEVLRYHAQLQPRASTSPSNISVAAGLLQEIWVKSKKTGVLGLVVWVGREKQSEV